MLTIIPKPLSVTLDEGTIFAIKEVCFDIAEQLTRVKKDLEKFVKEKTNFQIVDNSYVVRAVIDKKTTAKEGYKLQLKSNELILSGGTEEGLFRGAQSVKQLFTQELCEATIEDEPANDYRGFMLDVGRYFYPIEHVKEIIEWASRYKLNYFHLHLTEDQGWRFESKKYPILTEKASHRSHTNFNCKKEGGFYTQEQLSKLVAFAKERFIEIIPEIDMPGHMVSAISCFPELSCFERKMKVATHWGVKHDILCGGKDFTYQFCKDIIDELCEVFDSEYIHIGGDEAPKFRWDVCPNCAKKMSDNNLKSTEELQHYFTNEMAQHIASHGKKTMMWYDYNKHPTSLNKDIIQQYWAGSQVNENFVNKCNGGISILNSNSNAYYIDLPYGKISLRDSYTTPTEFEGVDKSSIIGIEACLWTEYVKNIKKAKFNTFPRFLAIAEAMWTPTKNRDYQLFLTAMDLHKDFLKRFYIKLPREKVYNPSKFRKFCSSAWFEKRQLTWEGLHFLFDDAKVRKMAKKRKIASK